MHEAAEVQLFLIEPLVVLATGETDRVVLGVNGLDQHLSGELAAAGASGHLGEQLKGALGGAEVGQSEADVGRHDSDQGDGGDVVAFCDHLRSHEVVELSGAELAEYGLILAAAADVVAVEPRDAGAGKEL